MKPKSECDDHLSGEPYISVVDNWSARAVQYGTKHSSILTPARINELSALYRTGLLEDVIPFWLRHAVDREYGGFMFCVDRDGTVIDTDKRRLAPRPHGVDAGHPLQHRRAAARMAGAGQSMASTSCATYGFDSDGRMFFHRHPRGQPVRKRRYFFSETFMIACPGRLCPGHGRPPGPR